MARRTCPACAMRYAGLVDPGCPVCEGVGVLGLHPVALAPVGLKPTDAAVVARAVELYLEAAAREAAGQLPLGDPRTEALAEAADRLRKARIVGPPLGVPDRDMAWIPLDPETRAVDAEAQKTAHLMGQPNKPQDVANLDADPVLYSPEDRPRALGLLPERSQNGYQSQLAKAADPVDALGPDTLTLAFERQNRDHGAQVIASAVNDIVMIRNRKDT